MINRVGPARSVRIAVPAYTALTDDTRRSIVSGAAALVAAGIEVQDLDAYSSCYIDFARNVLVERFLQSPATDLVFIDSDVGFDPEQLVRLCQCDRPFVAGIYPMKTKPARYPAAPLGVNGGIWSDEGGFIDCAWLPTGFMRINRAVFDALDVPRYGDEHGTDMGAYFLCAVRDGKYWGEDVEFCRLVREAGGHAWAFSDMDLRHVASDGEVFEGNWGAHMRSQLLEAA